ncbi:EF-hand domain-containing protein [Maricaulis parjimensis]|uniref:EF-hand domain-containing protein n=1 Tax=Maricaulis parjimensis TaxID=144023 RepID=UPI00193A5E31|nr:EF-hand domain-containing protein [Maricaulis parjimensis]
MTRREKQSESLEIRLGYSAKQAFMEACREKGLTASEVVRDFVEAYPVAPQAGRGPRILNKITEFPMSLAASTLLMFSLGASALLTVQPATADVHDPETSFASIDRDGDGAFNLIDLYHEAGLTEDGRLGPELRAEAVGSMQDALAEFGPRFQEEFLSPEYVESIIAEAEESARDSVAEAFDDIDTDGDGRVEWAEFLTAWNYDRPGGRQMTASDEG